MLQVRARNDLSLVSWQCSICKLEKKMDASIVAFGIISKILSKAVQVAKKQHNAPFLLKEGWRFGGGADILSVVKPENLIFKV